MQAVYVLNEEPFYMTMASYSFRTLREHNPNLPVLVCFIEDNCRDSRGITNKENLAKKIKLIDKQELFKLCKELNIEIKTYHDLDLKEEKGYFSAQRIVFSDCLFERAILIDADTFIFEDITCLFDIYKDCDFAATTNTFGDHYHTNWKNKSVRSFNSGVVLFNNYLLKRYGDVVYYYCLSLKKKIHPMGEWIYKVSQNASGREELSFTLFALDNDLNYVYFDSSHVEKEFYRGPTKIFHTLSHNWLNFVYNTYMKMKESKVVETFSPMQKERKLFLPNKLIQRKQ
jgi:hypothetical protein